MKERLDVLLVNRGFFGTRERAKTSIMAGKVFVDGNLQDKPGTKFDSECEIDVKEDPVPYVSRGGLKLEKSIETFGIELEGKTCMDIGASTGGFTDCMLINGAAKVYAVDVGYGQLDWKLRNDERVVNMERTNFRYFEDESLNGTIDFISCDVSFISLGLIIPGASKLLSVSGEMVLLVKPQFEAGREQVGKKGIVKDPFVHKEVIEKVIGFLDAEGLVPYGLTSSPITGAKGNIEFLLHVGKDEELRYNLACIQDVVTNAHEELKL